MPPRRRFRLLPDRASWARLLRDPAQPRRTALSAALGAFLGATPVLGLHTWMAAGLAALLRLPPLAAVLGSNLSNPLSFTPITLLEIRIGCWILDRPFQLIPSEFSARELGPYVLAAWVGTPFVGAAMALVTFATMRHLQRRGRNALVENQRGASKGSVSE